MAGREFPRWRDSGVIEAFFAGRALRTRSGWMGGNGPPDSQKVSLDLGETLEPPGSALSSMEPLVSWAAPRGQLMLAGVL